MVGMIPEETILHLVLPLGGACHAMRIRVSGKKHGTHNPTHNNGLWYEYHIPYHTIPATGLV
eukprot:scaffold42258_cov244-Amphora_coffeaeformis.AAC.1